MQRTGSVALVVSEYLLTSAIVGPRDSARLTSTEYFLRKCTTT